MVQGVAWRALDWYLAAVLGRQRREARKVRQQYASMRDLGERVDFASGGYTTPVTDTVQRHEREQWKHQSRLGASVHVVVVAKQVSGEYECLILLVFQDREEGISFGPSEWILGSINQRIQAMANTRH